jgi:hypothetical protein
MKVETKGHTTIIKDMQEDLTVFLMKLTREYKTFEKHNLIIDISHCKEVSVKEVDAFLPLSNIHKKANKSFVIIASDFDFNKASDKLSIVPTRLEAHDIIEMEEIERDLGF